MPGASIQLNEACMRKLTSKSAEAQEGKEARAACPSATSASTGLAWPLAQAMNVALLCGEQGSAQGGFGDGQCSWQAVTAGLSTGHKQRLQLPLGARPHACSSRLL